MSHAGGRRLVGRPILLLAAGLLLLCEIGCTPTPRYRHFPAPSPDSRLLFSSQRISGAFTGREHRFTGHVFYVAGPDAYNTLPWIDGFEFEDGRVIDYVGFGWIETAALFKQLDDIAFESFDFGAEVDRAIQACEEVRHSCQAATLDGFEWEITVALGDVRMSFRRWNPSAEIDLYASYNPKIAKLKEVIDAFARLYGRAKFSF